MQAGLILARHPRRRVDCSRRFFEFLVDLVQVSERAANFISQRGISLKKVRAFRPHPVEQGLQHIEVTSQPKPSGAENPDPVFLPPTALTVSKTKLIFVSCDEDTYWALALFRIT